MHTSRTELLNVHFAHQQQGELNRYYALLEMFITIFLISSPLLFPYQMNQVIKIINFDAFVMAVFRLNICFKHSHDIIYPARVTQNLDSAKKIESERHSYIQHIWFTWQLFYVSLNRIRREISIEISHCSQAVTLIGSMTHANHLF